ncbi:MAG: molecular chaperone DnaJ, partial [Acidobacteria bacterium]|nr:molecular chaperone DnaJ [Acidobacteriota bacterium]
EKTLRVRIPAGMEEGSQLRVSGEGEGGSRGGPAGSLYVVVHIPEHEFFKRDGRDLYCELPITFSRAYLGGEVKVKTLGGSHKVKISAGTQSGDAVRLKGKGLPTPGSSGRGDQVVVLRVVTPSGGKQGKKMDELFRQLAELEGEEPSLESRDLIDRVKDFFA